MDGASGSQEIFQDLLTITNSSRFSSAFFLKFSICVIPSSAYLFLMLGCLSMSPFPLFNIGVVYVGEGTISICRINTRVPLSHVPILHCVNTIFYPVSHFLSPTNGLLLWGISLNLCATTSAQNIRGTRHPILFIIT